MPDALPRTSALYRLATRIAVGLAGRVLSRGAAVRAHHGRLAAPARLEQWSRQHRDLARPLAWFHAASVGESLQAKAVIAAFRALRPDWQIVATHFSASAERLADGMGADLVEYVPYDRRRDVARALAALTPRLLVFTKLDLWPELATTAARTGVRTALVAGTVDAGSSRRRWPTRVLCRPGYQVLDRVGAITEGDAARLSELGAAPARITVTGDPRVDSVLGRIAVAPHPTALADPMLMVAGSTWPADEAILLEAFAAVRAMHAGARLWLIPHEPTESARAAIAAGAASLALPEPVAAAESGPLAVISEMGVLAGLYGRGGIAYVGGGFGTRGVHSVLEPAAAAVPIMIGPRDRGLRDAALLESTGGLVRLPATDPVGTLAAQWSAWLAEPAAARHRGEAARAALVPDQGAAVRSAELLDELVA